MFKASITQTPFTTDTANAYFQNITGLAFGYDVSFIATLRALLAPRMGEEDRVHLKFGSSNYEASSLRGVSDEVIVNAICNDYRLSLRGQLIIHNLKSNQEGNEACFKAVEKKFTSLYNGYHQQEKLKDIAAEAGMNLSTAKSRLRRGRQRLKEILTQGGDWQ